MTPSSTPAPTPRVLLRTAVAVLGDRYEAELLLMHALDVDRAWLFAHATDALEADPVARFEILLERRRVGEPVAHIVGTRGFWDMNLVVTPDTLIPRPETELLVEQALQRLPLDAPLDVADLGTGSGAIALALARERPRARVLATDMSAKALAVARENARRHGLARVGFVRGSWCAALSAGCFDMLVSNPPYIEAADSHLERGDLRFEPSTALASGADGLDAIREIVRDARRHLVDGGWLLMEHGWNQAVAVRRLLEQAGYLGVFTERDIEGRDRVSGGHK